MSSVEKAHLRALSTLFLHQKKIIGIEVEITEKMRVIIAAQACDVGRAGVKPVLTRLCILIYTSVQHT